MTSSFVCHASSKRPFRIDAKIPRILTALICATFAGGCATLRDKNPLQETFASDDPCANNARNIGIISGALLGALLGNQIKHDNTTRILTGTIGATIGGMIGADIDRRRCELSKIAKANGLDMQIEAISMKKNLPPKQEGTEQADATQGKVENIGLRVAIRDNDRQFQSGSAELSPEAKSYFRQIADQYSYTQQQRSLKPTTPQADRDALNTLKAKRILLVGHTDDAGASQQNADLSERRARAVAVVFQERGIAADQLFFQGAGETLPIADNRTDDGRARNRRVEIVDLNDDGAFRAYLASRQPKIAYYRPSAAPEANTVNPITSIAPVTANTASAPTSAPTAQASGAQTKHQRPIASADKAKPRVASSPSRDNVTNTSSTSTPAENSASTANPAALDFGGQRATAPLNNADIGNLVSGKTFNVISQAHADESPVGNCTQDRPRIAHGVKSLKDNKEYSTSDYLPGVYDSSWAAQVNGHLVALTNVAVLRDGGSPAHKPKLLVYRDYRGDPTAKPDHSGVPEVNTYQGDKALLYRVFSSGPIRCMDIVIPNDNPREAPRSALFYNRANLLYTAAFNPKLTK